MARVSPIQDSFQAGFLGQRVRGRVNSDIYKDALAKCENWHPLVQGPIRLRPGSQYVIPVDNNNWVSGQPGVNGIRCFTFSRGLDEDVIIEVGETDINAYSSVDGSPIIGGVSDNLITDPTFATLPRGLPSPVASAEWQGVVGKYIFGADPGESTVQPPSPSQGEFNGVTGDEWFVVPPSETQNIVKLFNNSNDAPSGFNGCAISNTLAVPVVLPAGSELLLNEFSFVWQYLVTGNELTILGALPWADPFIRLDVGTTPGASDVFTSDTPISAVDEWVQSTISFTPGGGNTILYFTIGVVWTGATPAVPDIDTDLGSALPVYIANLSWVAPLTGGSGSTVNFASPYTAEQMECLQYCMDPGEKVAYFTHPEVETRRLRLALGEWTFEALSAITLPSVYVAPTPDLWAAGNFPAACTFHEGRLWLAGSPVNPATLWASRSGDYQDFGNAAPASADDPLLFPLSSAGNIQSLTSRKELVINTDISEVVGTSVGGIIQFEDFSFPKQTDWGANCVQPMVVGRDMIYTSNSRRKVRTFADEGGTNYGWDGNELSLIAADLFDSPVRRMEYLDEPAYQACFLLANGNMAMSTYFYPENVIGWWLYRPAYNGNRTYGDDTQPGLGNQAPNVTQAQNQIMDICKINTSQGSKLWMIINRVGFAGTQIPAHELLAFDEPTIPPIAMDSWAGRSIDPIANEITGIDFLTDQSINCVVQRTDPVTGVVSYTIHPNLTAIAGFSSPFESWALETGNIAYVGLFFDNEFELLPVEGVSNRGTAQVSRRRWSKVYARINDSAIPLINGQFGRDRTPSTPMGTGEPIVTADIEYSELGSTDQGQLNIIQDKPLQTEILALFGKVQSSEI